MKYGNWTLGQVEAVFNKLGGEEGVGRFLRGELKVVEVTETLCYTLPVEIGRYKNKSATKVMAEQVLKSAGNRISDWARRNILLLGEGDLVQEEETLMLRVASGRELCGNRNATIAEIFAAGRARGWKLCPPETAPALWEQYVDQPSGEWLRIAMEPIVGSDGVPRVFDVGCGGDGRWLRALNGHPTRMWCPDSLWVFLLPSKP